MPSIAVHLASAKVISNMFGINSDDFILGVILPDIILDADSHYKVKGTNFLIPDILYFRKRFDLTQDIYKGYLAHLLLDKYFLENFVPMNIQDLQNIFISGTIYEDYSRISADLLSHYQIDSSRVRRIICSTPILLDLKKRKINLEYLDSKKSAKPLILDYNKLIEFIDTISIKIGRDILYDQHNYMYVRFRQCRKY